MTSPIASFLVTARQDQGEIAVTMPVPWQHSETAPELTTIDDWTQMAHRQQVEDAVLVWILPVFVRGRSWIDQ